MQLYSHQYDINRERRTGMKINSENQNWEQVFKVIQKSFTVKISIDLISRSFELYASQSEATRTRMLNNILLISLPPSIGFVPKSLRRPPVTLGLVVTN